MRSPLDAGALKDTVAPVGPLARATTPVGASGGPVTTTVIVPWTTREGSLSLSLTR